MSVGENQTIAVNEVRRCWIVFQDATVKNMCERRKRHRSSLVTAVRSQWRIHRNSSNYRNSEGVLFGAQLCRHLMMVIGARLSGRKVRSRAPEDLLSGQL